jgi:chemotaxis protein MotB
MGLDPSEAEDHVCEEGAPAWLATMGDLMSLLLVFFVLMLSFANTDEQLFMEAMGSIQAALGVIEDNPGRFEVRSTSMIEWNEKKSTPFLDIMNMEQSNDSPSMDQKIMQKVQQAISNHRRIPI